MIFPLRNVSMLIGLLAIFALTLSACQPPTQAQISAELTGQNAPIFSNPVSELQGSADSSFARADGQTPVTFPDDFGPHPEYQTEWWYYTGNLRAQDGRHFGFQLTFFRRALLPPGEWLARESRWDATQAYMAHFAITDTRGERHAAFERLSRGAAGLAGAQAQPFKVWLEDWTIEQTGAQDYRLYAAQDDVRLELNLRDLKGPVLQGDAGYSQKGPESGNASYYFSQTRLQAQGTLSVSGASYPVSGFSWMDHEYSTSALSQGQVGWDWFSIQLDNDSELMLFQIRRDDGSIDPFSSGAYIAPDGSTRQLSRQDFQIDVLDTWRSPITGAIYPSRWRIQIPALQLSLELTPHLADQELDLTYAYWEGAVSASGQIAGIDIFGDGYVELTGYTGSMAGEF